MVLKMHDSIPNLSADEVRGAGPSLLALGKQKHTRWKPNAPRPEINSAALRHWFGHDQRTLRAPWDLRRGSGRGCAARRLSTGRLSHYAGVDPHAQMLIALRLRAAKARATVTSFCGWSSSRCRAGLGA